MRQLKRHAVGLTLVILLNFLWEAHAHSTAGDQVASKAAGGSRRWSVDDFLRLRRDSSRTPVALETSIVRFEGVPGPKSGLVDFRNPVTVDLVAAVHIADPAYYRTLNNHLERYNAVMYELVASPDARFAPGEAPWDSSLLGLGQRISASVLGLQFQLDGINYKATNFVHADMTPEQFKQSIAERGESAWQILLRLVSEAMKSDKPLEAGLDELWHALQQRGRAGQIALRRWAAKQFTDVELAIRAVEGPHGSTLLSERNNVALQVLRQQLQKGKRNVAIFYGAAHMPDFATRLQEEWDLRAKAQHWLVAWDLSD